MAKPSFFSRGDAWAGLAGSFSLALALGVRFSVGRVYNAYEAERLLKSLIEGGLFLASTVATTSATVLALMLTVLGFVRQVDADFDRTWFGQIRWVSILASVTFALSVLTLLLMSVPLSESKEIPAWWNLGIYYTVSGAVAVLTGLTVSLVAMLLAAVLGIIERVAPNASVSEDAEAE